MKKYLHSRIRGLKKNSFIGNVSQLVGGTAFAQLVSVLVLPVLTRLYSPSDFSVLALYASMLSFLSIIACLRLEIAIPLPSSEGVAARLLALAISFVLIYSFFILSLLYFSSDFKGLLGYEVLGSYVYLLPIGVFFSGLYAATQYWATRNKKFVEIRRSRVVQSLSGASAQLSFGVFGFTSFGLIFGQLLNSGAGVLRLGALAYCDIRRLSSEIRPRALWHTLVEYKNFPKYSTLEALSNSGGTHLPVIIIASLLVGPEAGFLMLASRVMAVPIALIGGAVSQVYLSRAPAEFRAGNLGVFTLEVVAGLFKSGVALLFLIGSVSPFLVPYVFGSDWARTGELVLIMTPWFVMQFISSPVSMTLHVTGQQRTALGLQLIGLIMRVGAVLVGLYFAQNIVVELFAFASFLFYVIYLVVVLRVLNISVVVFARRMGKESMLPVLAAMTGIVFYQMTR